MATWNFTAGFHYYYHVTKAFERKGVFEYSKFVVQKAVKIGKYMLIETVIEVLSFQLWIPMSLVYIKLHNTRLTYTVNKVG